MTDTVLALVPVYGLPLLALVTCLSCLAIPVPSSIVMMLMGSFVAAGEFTFLPVFLTALAAAIAGDQFGFLVGRAGGSVVIARIADKPSRRETIEKARDYIDRHGRMGVFFTRWLLSPLGPYVNVITGATGFSWTRFTFFGALGELVWVTIYVGLGALFSDDVLAIAEIAGDASGFLAAGAVTLLLGLRLLHVVRRNGNKRAPQKT